MQIYEVTGAGAARTRLQAAAGRGLTRFVGRDVELEQLRRAQQLAGHGHGQVVAIVGEAGVGKSRLVHEFVHSNSTADWLVLESNSASYGRATPYLPVIELLRDYFKINVHDSTRSIREKVTSRILALDPALAGRDSADAGSPRCAGARASVPVARPAPASAVHVSGSHPPVVERKPSTAGRGRSSRIFTGTTPLLSVY